MSIIWLKRDRKIIYLHILWGQNLQILHYSLFKSLKGKYLKKAVIILKRSNIFKPQTYFIISNIVKNL